LDYQNVWLVGHAQYGRGCETFQGVPEPAKLADLIASRRDVPSKVTAIGVFRGRPDPRHEPRPASANDKQAQNWERDPRLRMFRRPLTYRGWPPGRPAPGTRYNPPIEKGVDVALAVELVRLSLMEQARFEALVVFSSDTDLVPALDLCQLLGGPVIEVACWEGANALQDRQMKLPACHYLSEADWRSVCKDWSGLA